MWCSLVISTRCLYGVINSAKVHEQKKITPNITVYIAYDHRHTVARCVTRGSLTQSDYQVKRKLRFREPSPIATQPTTCSLLCMILQWLNWNIILDHGCVVISVFRLKKFYQITRYIYKTIQGNSPNTLDHVIFLLNNAFTEFWFSKFASKLYIISYLEILEVLVLLTYGVSCGDTNFCF